MKRAKGFFRLGFVLFCVTIVPAGFWVNGHWVSDVRDYLDKTYKVELSVDDEIIAEKNVSHDEFLFYRQLYVNYEAGRDWSPPPQPDIGNIKFSKDRSPIRFRASMFEMAGGAFPVDASALSERWGDTLNSNKLLESSGDEQIMVHASPIRPTSGELRAARRRRQRDLVAASIGSALMAAFLPLLAYMAFLLIRGIFVGAGQCTKRTAKWIADGFR